MDDKLKQIIKDKAKAFSAQTPYRGNIADDRMRPMKEACFEEGARQMYELLKLRLGNWIDQVCVNFCMESADGISVNIPIPEGWVNKDDGALSKMGIMMPGGGLKSEDGKGFPNLFMKDPLNDGRNFEDILNRSPLVPPVLYGTSQPEWETPGYTKIMRPLVVETNDILVPIAIGKEMRDILVATGCDIVNDGDEEIITINELMSFKYDLRQETSEQPNRPVTDERSVATDAKSKPKKSATKPKK